jgi:SM-20-related protein
MARGATALRMWGGMQNRKFEVNPRLDVDSLAKAYASERRVQIRDFLEPSCAELLFAHLKAETRWKLIFNQGDKLFEIARTDHGAIDDERKRQLDLAVYKGARAGFQYRFENIRVPDSAEDRSASGSLLDAFGAFLSSDAVLSLLKRIIGDERINHADAQATAYAPGHFLTTHDDEVAGKSRRAAYVLNLTPAWSVDWGGLLLFTSADGLVERAIAPTFNALNLFSVPQPHCVSMVAPFAPNRRYSITGWLRSI